MFPPVAGARHPVRSRFPPAWERTRRPFGSASWVSWVKAAGNSRTAPDGTLGPLCEQVGEYAPASYTQAVRRFRRRGRSGPPSPSEQVSDEVDEQTGQAPHHGPVDADELEVATNHQLETVGRLGRIPALH